MKSAKAFSYVALLLLSNQLFAQENQQDQLKQEKSFYAGLGLTLGKFASNDNIKGLSGPNGESFTGFNLTGGMLNNNGFGAKLEFSSYEVTKSWVDNVFPNEWNWNIKLFGITGHFRKKLSPPTNSNDIFAGVFAGPIVGLTKLSIEESNPIIGFVDSGDLNSTDFGFIIGGNVTFMLSKDVFGLTIEPSYTKLSSSMGDKIDVDGNYNLGSISIKAYLFYVFPQKS